MIWWCLAWTNLQCEYFTCICKILLFSDTCFYCRPNNDVLHNKLGWIGMVANDNDENAGQERRVKSTGSTV